MKRKWNATHKLWLMVVLGIISLAGAGSATGALTAGQSAPGFSLTDISGRQRVLAETQGRQMTVLFFFDAASSASQEGLLMLDKLLKQHKDQQLTVWGITRSDPAAAREFSRKAELGFPILLDTADVSSRYEARIILPVVCTLGPGLKILDYFQGGGKSAEVMLVRLAERQMHRDQPQLAQAMAVSVAKKDPGNLEAKAVEGYAALAQGKTAEAAQVFDRLAAAPGQGAVIGKEGQAAVLARQGKSDQALALAEEVTRTAPRRATAHKIKGDLLMAKGNRQAAAAAYQAAVQQPEAPAFQKAEANNQLGRLYAQEGQYSKARALFDQAVALDPYYLEPTSNKGVSYEKEGMWTQALSEYRRALTLDRSDTMTDVLARKAEQMLALQKNTAGKQRMDRLIKELAERYKTSKKNPTAVSQDEWTSRPMVLSFVDIQEKGGLSARDGLSIVMATRLGELLTASGRVRVVERAIIEGLLSELNLGSSELADPQTALQLGKLLAAKLIGTGSLMYLPDSTLLSLRLIDTETTAVAKVINHRLSSPANLERELFDLNRDILKTVMEKYPLQGFVVQLQNQEAMLNLGSNQGVAVGSVFEAIETGQAITYKGRQLQGQAKVVARLEVVRVEPDLCFARIIDQQRAPVNDDKVREVISAVGTQGGGHGQ